MPDDRMQSLPSNQKAKNALIGWILSSVVLAVLYCPVLTPIGVLLRLTGYDPMKRRFDRKAKTYWLARNPDTEMERYFKQF